MANESKDPAQPPQPTIPMDMPKGDPTDSPPAPPENKELTELKRQNQEYLERLSTQSDQLKAQDERLKKLESPPPLKPSDKEMNERFYANPLAETRTIVKEELKETIAPLLSFVEEFRGGNRYTQLKAKYRNDPRFKPLFDRYEGYIDRGMQKAEPTDQALLGVLTSLAGALHLGIITDDQPSTGEDPTVQTPPYTRPSPPPPPKPPAKQPRTVTEEQRRLMRENHMTEEEYFKHYDEDRLTVSAEEVTGGKK